MDSLTYRMLAHVQALLRNAGVGARLRRIEAYLLRRLKREENHS